MGNTHSNEDKTLNRGNYSNQIAIEDYSNLVELQSFSFYSYYKGRVFPEDQFLEEISTINSSEQDLTNGVDTSYLKDISQQIESDLTVLREEFRTSILCNINKNNEKAEIHSDSDYLYL